MFQRNVRFSKCLAWFVFLKHPFWDSPFCLFNYDFSLTINYIKTKCFYRHTAHQDIKPTPIWSNQCPNFGISFLENILNLQSQYKCCSTFQNNSVSFEASKLNIRSSFNDDFNAANMNNFNTLSVNLVHPLNWIFTWIHMKDLDKNYCHHLKKPFFKIGYFQPG